MYPIPMSQKPDGAVTPADTPTLEEKPYPVLAQQCDLYARPG